MGQKRRKGERGAATNFISRNQALKKLQLSLPDFRRLCILKGIYPREPRNKKKVNKGSSAHKTYYYVKDILFLSHEPVLQKFRDFKVFIRKLNKAFAKDEMDTVKRLEENKPVYHLDHIVKERYPSFLDALRDLDDCLSMVFLFSCMPQTDKIKHDIVRMCKRLSVEFQNYIINTQALCKVFVSIKGIYYQAEIQGQKVTWVVPHKFTQEIPNDVDFRIMVTFIEFFTCMLGFVNFHLYHNMNLHYPPKLAIDDDATLEELEYCDDVDLEDERLATLNHALVQASQVAGDSESKSNGMDGRNSREGRKRYSTWLFNIFDLHSYLQVVQDFVQDFVKVYTLSRCTIGESTEETIDEFPAEPGSSEEEAQQRAKEEDERLRSFRNLFNGCKIYISREVPRDALVFIIRSFGGNVSWDKIVGLGSSFTEDDEQITHQVVDRPNFKGQYITRKYIQPQWVFDSVNAGRLQPVDDYLPGAVLPPHLSPFVEEKADEYVPPERQAILEEEKVLLQKEQETKTTDGKSEDGSHKSDGQLKRKNDNLTKEEKSLAIMMMPKKKRKLYDKIMHSKKQKAKEVRKLTEKRKEIESKRARTK